MKDDLQENNKRGFTPPELIIALLLISGFIFFLVKKYKNLEFQAKKTIAKIDVKNLNLAIVLYKYKFGRLPENLYELKKNNLLKVNSTPIISKKSFFKKEKLIDPFGNPYIYDNKTGTVKFSKQTLLILKRE